MKDMSMTSRRGFIGSLGAFAALSGCKSVSELLVSRTPRLKFGVTSDIHRQFRAYCDDFERGLVSFREAGVDAVVLAGDLADCGNIRELKYIAGCWNRVFPNDTAPDGRHVERVFVTGNHDVNHIDPCKNGTWLSYYNGDLDRIRADAMTLRPGGIARAWEECFGEKYEPIYRKTVKGYDFICAHWGSWNGAEDIDAYMKKVGPTLDPSKPFFYVQHPHPKGTVYADWAWGEDDGRSTRALSAYPNAVAFSGHSHFTLTSDWSIWQGAFTSIGTATFSAGLGVSYGGRENGHPFPGEKPHMLKAIVSDVRQAMIVTVYDDFVSVDRRDLSTGLPLGEPWAFTTPASADSPYVPSTRAAAVGAPRYEGENLNELVKVEQGAPEHGCEKDKKHWTVRFPVPPPKGDTRAYDFEVALLARYNNVMKPFKVKRVLCPSAHYPPAREAKEAFCVFSDDELPKSVKGRWNASSYRFAVTPLSSMGVRGNTIYSEEIA